MRPSSTATAPTRTRSAMTMRAFRMSIGWPSRNSTSLAPVLLEERLGGERAKIVERSPKRRMVPVPPGERVHAFPESAGKARLEDFRRNAGDNHVRFDVVRHDRA